MSKKPEIIVEIKTYADGVLVAQTAKAIKPETDWVMWTILAIVIPFGLWFMVAWGVI